jgi:predicted 2-oxoglutarate/Fe(II)-dependent dioxygenase YbiX
LELYKPFQLFTQDECNELIHLAQQSPEKNGKAGGNYNPGVRNNKVFWIDYSNADYIQHQMTELLDEYPVTWLEKPIQVSKYDQGEFYHWHKDQLINSRTSSRLLTLTCTLQHAPGGLFETRDHSFDLNAGEAVIIPSDIDHRALPPVSGIRWALTAWGMGANPNL